MTVFVETFVGTGHRPDKVLGYSRDASDKLRYFAESFLRSSRPSRVISGMAQGWDMALAQAGVLLKIPLFAFIPFVGQESVWPDDAQRLYRALLGRATEVVVCSEGGYAVSKMQTRNIRMVDELTGPRDMLVALWNGSFGGTANCVRYAETRDVVICNLWDQWRQSK